MLGVDSRTPGYLVREELQRDKLRGRAGKRAWGFERRLEERRGSELARKCWVELKERARKGREGKEWEGERRKHFDERGVDMEELERKRKQGGVGYEELEKEEKKRKREERWERIIGSKYNRWYKVVKGEGLPEYLKKGWKRIARFRLGNEVRDGNYWEEEEKRRCRLCGVKKESWEHVWEECRNWKVGGGSWQDAVCWVLGQEGEGEWWMREIEEERGNGGKGGGEVERICE
ncbi:hypothetical protein X777_11275 [Ooceraea biroi]|uniref:Reverse transcriptase zinc-binding domain-containing protein n=1 Tax=Ooceraea biroi TaxID=2015173 RepID=A0A026W400_OOCBI|nr:hypothetical protein X777_11275 [Ooceraea biroi]